MLSPNAVAFRELLAPKSKSADAWDEAVELLLLLPPPQPAAVTRRARPRQTSRTKRERPIMTCLQG